MTLAAPSLGSGPVRRVLDHLKSVESRRGYWVARCPAHEDETASLSIKAADDGRALLNCHAGCNPRDVVRAMGLEMSDLFPETPDRPRKEVSNGSVVATAPGVNARPRMVKSYDYTDADGTLLFQVCRFAYPDGKKTFKQRRPDGKGDWIPSLGEVAPVLYRLPDVAAAVESGRPVYVVEGEKDADALADLGYVATTCPMGAGKWREPYTDALRGAEVVILPDNDDPGRSHAEQVAAALTAAGGLVKVVTLPGLPPKGDVSDWLAAGGDLDTLARIVGETPRWKADGLARTRWRLDELWENDSIMRPPPPIVPRLAWAGRSTLLAAREKAGKSTLTGYITACVSNGQPFLEAPCAEGDVLVIGLEEFIGDTARRLRHFEANPTRVHLVDRFAGAPELRPEELREHIAAVAPVLVVIDSLTAYSHGQIQDDNNATQMAKVVQPLTDVVHQLGTALLLIHHVTKATGRARGSTAITAAVDMVVEFDIPEEITDPTRRRVRSVGRFSVPRVYDVRFDGDTYVLADGTEAPIEQQILAVVMERPRVSKNDVADAVRGQRQHILTTITNMVTDGQLANVGTKSRPKLVVPGPHLWQS